MKLNNYQELSDMTNDGTYYNIDVIKNKLYKSKKIKDLNALHEYENNYDYMPQDMKSKFDGEVSILIIN